MHSEKGYMSEHRIYLLGFYVPEKDLENVLQAVFAAGAGKFGNYDHCAWTVKGEGRFRPLKNSRPAFGKAGEETRLAEVKVECIVEQPYLKQVREALIKAHPYEEPAYHFVAADGA